MSHLFEHLAALLAAETAVALATIVQVKGSSPREVGAQMIVHPFGRHVGTVGGGCGEADALRAGLDVLVGGPPRLVTVDLTEPLTMESQGVCGGVLTVYVERWSAADAPLAQALAQAIGQREAVALVTPLETAARALVYADPARRQPAPGEPESSQLTDEARAALAAGEHRLVSLPTGGRAFVQVIAPPPHLIICGAGHIAVPLAQMAALCDYDVTVIDDRATFANAARFPSARTVRVGDFRSELRALRDGHASFGPHTALVLVTRGHQHDVDCLLEVIHDDLDYIGMIGSKRRIRAVFEMLQREHGIGRERFARVFAPVGLDIGSRTPGEIAVAILAEMISVARGGRGVSLSRS